MTSEEERQIAKISHEKPTAVDLGPAGAIVGESCVDGKGVNDNSREPLGNGAAVGCWTVGNVAGTSDEGNTAALDCDEGSGFVG